MRSFILDLPFGIYPEITACYHNCFVPNTKTKIISHSTHANIFHDCDEFTVHYATCELDELKFSKKTRQIIYRNTLWWLSKWFASLFLQSACKESKKEFQSKFNISRFLFTLVTQFTGFGIWIGAGCLPARCTFTSFFLFSLLQKDFCGGNFSFQLWTNVENTKSWTVHFEIVPKTDWIIRCLLASADGHKRKIWENEWVRRENWASFIKSEVSYDIYKTGGCRIGRCLHQAYIRKLLTRGMNHNATYKGDSIQSKLWNKLLISWNSLIHRFTKLMRVHLNSSLNLDLKWS